MELIGKMIRQTRQERRLTQEEVGKLIGVQKAQISRLKNNANNVTLRTIFKVFRALKAEIQFNVKMDDRQIQLS